MASTTNAYIAKRQVNISMLMGNYIDDLVFTIQNPDGTPFDFSTAVAGDGFYLRIYSNRTSSRVLEDTLSETDGDMTEALGVITVDTTFPTALTFGQYNYELDYQDAEGFKRLAEGTLLIK
jgi:hypothetical protein